MANPDVVTGLKPVMHLNGAPYNGAVTKYFVPATDTNAIFVGDPVTLAGSADARGIPTVARGVAGGVFAGVMVGRADVTRDDPIHREASQAQYIFVVDDPSVLFEVQEDSVGGALAATNIGQNASLVNGGGNAISGLSGVELDSSTAAVTATLDFQILRMVDREDNEFGLNAKFIVKLNNHQFVDGATGI